jgi:DNA-binding GntR family transcriptional regulator
LAACSEKDRAVLRPKAGTFRMLPSASPLSARSVAERIEQDIYLGQLPPGSWLKQIDLERRYRCSRIALRQALDHVATKGIIHHERNKGYRVALFEGEFVTHLTETRAIVETAAAESVLPYVEPDYLDELKIHAVAFRDGYAGANELQRHELNLRFHDVLLRPCRNRTLVDLTFELRRRVPAAVSRRFNTPERVERLVQDHFDMIEALRRGDAASLKDLLWDHIKLG